jgi:ligand-binding sensor domain-containing protein
VDVCLQLVSRQMIDYTTIELELIFEEVAKLPKTTDTSYWVPDVLELVRQRIFDYELQ